MTQSVTAATEAAEETALAIKSEAIAESENAAEVAIAAQADDIRTEAVAAANA